MFPIFFSMSQGALDDAPRHAARRGGERPGPGEDDQARGHVPWGTTMFQLDLLKSWEIHEA